MADLSYYINDDNILVVYFSNGYYLELIDNSQQYESFTIKNEALEVII
jgi:hypothetical protein